MDSVLDMRRELTRTLQRLSEHSGAAYSARAMRDACYGFMRIADPNRMYEWQTQQRLVMGLGQLRGVFAVYLGGLADHYGITVHGPLAEIIDAVRPVDDAAADQ